MARVCCPEYQCGGLLAEDAGSKESNLWVEEQSAVITTIGTVASSSAQVEGHEREP